MSSSYCRRWCAAYRAGSPEYTRRRITGAQTIPQHRIIDLYIFHFFLLHFFLSTVSFDHDVIKILQFCAYKHSSKKQSEYFSLEYFIFDGSPNHFSSLHSCFLFLSTTASLLLLTVVSLQVYIFILQIGNVRPISSSSSSYYARLHSSTKG